MNFIKIAVIASMLSFMTGARAEESAAVATASNGSEYMYQTPGGKFAVTPHLAFTGVGVKYNETVTGRKDFSAAAGLIPVGVIGEYGITEMLAIGLDLVYLSSKTTYSCDSSSTTCPKDTTSKGLKDPKFSIKMRNGIGIGTLRYGTDVEVSIEKSKYDREGNSNAASGGTTVTPFVGYELPLGPGIIGGHAKYELYKGDRKTKTDGAANESTTSGGGELNVTAFYEANIGIMTYGGGVTYISKTASKSKSGSADAVGDKNAASGWMVKLYTPAHFTPNITLLPTVSLGGANYTSSGSSIDSLAIFEIGVAGRFTF